MTLDDLRVFVAVCEAKNLSAVARDLGCTQSAVSQHVRRLEHETGMVLVERGARGVAPTEAGRVLYAAAVDALGSLGDALRQLEAARMGEAGAVRVITGGTSVRHVLSRAVASFRERHPQAALDLQSANSTRRCLEAVLDDRADLAWITMTDPARGIEQRPVADMPWVLVVRDDDPRARRPVTKADLRSIRYITLRERATSRVQLEESLVALGVRLTSSTTVDDWDTAVMLVELGQGDAVVPALHGWALAQLHPVTPLPIPPIPPVTFGWAARRWDALGALTREFASAVAGQLAAVSAEHDLGIHVVDPAATGAGVGAAQTRSARDGRVDLSSG